MRWANFVFAMIFFRKSVADKDETIVAVISVHLSHWITKVPVSLLDEVFYS